MRTFLTPTQDATIYQRYPRLNTGLDEILEVGKNIASTDVPNINASGSSRILIQFDIPSAQQYPTSSKYFLNLRIASAKNVNRYQRLEVYPISSSWIEGSGYFYQDVRNVEDGVAWIYSSEDTSWAVSGSDFVSSPSASYTVAKFPLRDIRIDITNIIAPVVAGTNAVPWNGMLIKYPDSDEINSSNIGNIKFFSSNTHTVLSPRVEVAYVTQEFITGSLKPIQTSNLSILPKNLKQSYTSGEIDKIYVVVRDKYPDKRFDSVQRYKSIYYLPSSSYFRIRDEAAGVTLCEFDAYSVLNCDVTGSYITLDTTSFEPDRMYTLDLKVVKNDLVFFPEFNYKFRVDPNVG